ncbi:MAG TPA: glutamate 5-kinase [Blastocatellia bacterium]|nr:glutamate 5-kinase [Blastocatellia bacterium]
MIELPAVFCLIANRTVVRCATGGYNDALTRGTNIVSSDTHQRIDIVNGARRIVIKLGTSVLMREEGGIALSRFYSFVESISALKLAGREVLLVSSGAVGLGAERLKLETKPQTLPLKQACAAVGQGRLMSSYAEAFERLGVTTAQVLLIEDDFSNRRRYLNLRSTISQLLELGVLPVLNENDTVSTAELESLDVSGVRKVNFGDNDKLSALVASKIDADLLVILTDVEGIYSADPSREGAEIFEVVTDVGELEDLAGASSAVRGSGAGRGGIRTKLEAAKIATHSGCAVIVASGKHPGVIDRIFAGEQVGTLVMPKLTLPGKRRWIAFATSIKAQLVVNEGARRALVERKASLLAAGVMDVKGDFERGDVVSIIDEQHREFARGIVNYSSSEARRISGQHSAKIDELIENRNYDALVTRDNIALLDRR